ncbi:helix-turn-helix transcriptional regulator [Novosphingobium sediminis]|uniref:helix-turn-helix transcriptional regulator n=1 Tax=Novosphingobium sediminis TaxID=707214 RepID=UPI0011BFCF94|nr:helix-turn-helix transcriptional regulator [Novosphingobium sediminis]
MTPIVARSEALTLLLRMADAMRSASSGNVVVVSGEAGMGKTRLIDDFIGSEAARQPLARAACEQLNNPRPLGPWLDLAEVLGKSHGRAIAQATESIDPIGRVGQAILQLPRGTIIVLEDVHHADPGTLDVLRYVLRRLNAAPLLIVCSYRPEEVDLDHPLVSLLGALPAELSIRFEIPPLTFTEVADLCEKASLPPDPIYRLSDGNPQFVNELLRKGFRDGDRLPEMFKNLAATRLQRLNEAERTWIELLAFVPPPHGPDLPVWLSQNFDLDPRLIPASGALLANSAGGAFKREVMRLAVLELIPQFTQAAVRQRLLEPLKAAGERVCPAESWFRLAHEAGDDLAAAQGAIAAARAAEARGNLSDCVGHLAAALPHALAADAELHAQIAELWVCRSAVAGGLTDAMIGQVAKNVSHWNGLGDLHAAGTAQLLLARLLTYRGESGAAATCVSEAIRLLEMKGPNAELAAAHGLAADLAGERAEAELARAHLERALAVLADASGTAVRLEVELIEAVLAASQDEIGTVWSKLERCYAQASAHSLHELAARVQSAGCRIAFSIMDLDRASDWLGRPNPLLSGDTMNCWRTLLLGQRALIVVHTGQLDEASRLSDRALEGIGAPPAFAFPAILAQAMAAVRKGEPEAHKAISECVELAQRMGSKRRLAEALLGEIEYLALNGHRDKASELAKTCGQLAVESADPYNSNLAALWMFRLGHTPQDLGAALHGAVSEEFAGEGGAAAAVWLGGGYRFNASLARLYTVGTAAEAEFLEALQELQAMGALAGIALAGSLAAERGIRLPAQGRKRGPYRAARSHPLGLTRREVDILRMMVDGESNREIAERLGRSLRTVEHHVSAILGKIGIESRVQAVLYAVANPEILD